MYLQSSHGQYMCVALDFFVQIYYAIKTNIEKLSDHIATLNS